MEVFNWPLISGRREEGTVLIEHFARDYISFLSSLRNNSSRQKVLLVLHFLIVLSKGKTSAEPTYGKSTCNGSGKYDHSR